MQTLRNIVFIHHSTQYAGASKVLSDFLVNAPLDYSSCRLITFHRNPRLAEEASDLGIEVIVLSSGYSFSNLTRTNKFITQAMAIPISLASFSILFIKLLRVIACLKPTAIYANTFKTGILAGSVSIILRVPVVMRLHGVFSAQGVNAISRWLLRITGTFLVNEVLAVSYAVKQGAIKVGVPENKIKVILNGFDFDLQMKDVDTTQFGINPGDKYIALVGRITPMKNQLQGVELMRRLKNKGYTVKMLIVGEGAKGEDYFDQVKRKVQEYGLQDTVMFTGFVDSPLVYSLVRQSAFLLQTSLLIEALPTVLIEAVGVGTYVVASDVGGSKEIIFDASLGVLYDPYDDEDLLKQVEQALSSERIRNDSILQKFYQKFAMDSYCNNVQDVLQKYQ